MCKILVALIAFMICQTSHAQSLCKKPEISYFSCNIGRKILSLCGSDDLSKSGGYVQYRFGTNTLTELTYPEEKKHPKGVFFYNFAAQSSAMLAHINFKNGNFVYVIYDDDYVIDYKTGKREFTSGVSIIRDGKEIKDMKCSEKHKRIEMNFGTLEQEEKREIFMEGGFEPFFEQ